MRIELRAITPEQMRRIEENADRMGVTRRLLMENAGHAVADHIIKKFRRLAGKKIIVMAGVGNNGGDGFVAARHLSGYGADIKVVLLGRSENIRTKEAMSNWHILEKMKLTISLVEADTLDKLKGLKDVIAGGDILIDAILGTGVKGVIREPHSSAIDLINTLRVYKVAVDIPSGLDPSSGLVCSKSVIADVTITFHKPKRGLNRHRGFVGKMITVPIGVPPEADVIK